MTWNINIFPIHYKSATKVAWSKVSVKLYNKRPGRTSQCHLVHLAAIEQGQKVIPDHCLSGCYLKTSSDRDAMHPPGNLHQYFTVLRIIKIFLTPKSDFDKQYYADFFFTCLPHTAMEDRCTWRREHSLTSLQKSFRHLKTVIMSLPLNLLFPINSYMLWNSCFPDL